MKSVICAFLALLLVLLIVILNSILVSNCINEIIQRLEKTPNSINELQLYEDIYSDYMKKQRFMEISVNHDDLTNIESDFNEIIGAIEAKDEESLIIAKSRLIGTLGHLKRLVGINADSIL